MKLQRKKTTEEKHKEKSPQFGNAFMVICDSVGLWSKVSW